MASPMPGYPKGAPFGFAPAPYGSPAGYPGATATVPPLTAPPTAARTPREESYIENILRLNLGKIATIYMTYENNPAWPYKVYRGRLEAAGRDHIIISDPDTGMRYLLLMVNLDYITFDEPLNYFTTQPGVPG